MLYSLQRYFLGISSLFYVGLSAVMFAPIFAPGNWPGLMRPEIFMPLLDLFQIAAATVACLSILSVHPLVTDGAETHGMHTPLAHPGFHTVLVLAILAIPLFALSEAQPDRFWQAKKLADSCQHILQAAGMAAGMVVIGFYPLKWRGLLRMQIEREHRNRLLG